MPSTWRSTWPISYERHAPKDNVRVLVFGNGLLGANTDNVHAVTPPACTAGGRRRHGLKADACAGHVHTLQ